MGKRIHGIRFSFDNGLVSGISYNGTDVFISDDDKHNFNFGKDSALVINTIESSDLQDKTLYRFPKLNLPRIKVDLIKEKYNVSVTRNKDNADFWVISTNYIKNMCQYSWGALYTKEAVLESLSKTEAAFDNSVIDGFKEYLNKSVSDNDFIRFNTYWGYNNIPSFVDHLPDASVRNHYYMSEKDYSEITELVMSDKLILDTNVVEITSEELHVMTKEDYISCRKMISSNDSENLALALETISNCNLDKSYDYITLLYYFHYHRLKEAKNWNSVNVKALRQALTDFIPYNNNSNYGHFFESYLKALIKNNKFTEFAFKQCAQYVFHNVIKKSMGMSEESVFKINPDAIQLNPKYIDSLKTETFVFRNEIEDAVISL